MSKGAPKHIMELCNLSSPCSSLLGYYKDGLQSSMERIWRSTKKAPPRRGYRDNEHKELRVPFERFGHPRAKRNQRGEKERRFQIFNDNLKFINEHNASGNLPYKVGLNRFADLTNEEFRSWKDAIIRILVSTIVSSLYYLRGRIRMHFSSGAFPCLMLKKDDVITRKTVIIKNHYSNGAALKASCVLQIKKSTTMGVVGLPNVGKSSLINSLKRRHAVNVEATPGLTRFMQVVQLDKNVKLVDCLGVVMLKSGESYAVTTL
ncbi:guanine nucleotide-binding protein-like NSN1 [Tanacetum coccineum]